MYKPAVSKPVGWYQNLQYSESEPVKGCKDPMVRVHILKDYVYIKTQLVKLFI